MTEESKEKKEEPRPRWKSPAERAALLKQKRIAAIKRMKEERQQLRMALDEVLRTDGGKVLFKYLFNLCGYNKFLVAVDRVSGEVQSGASTYNDARRDTYVTLRRLAPLALLVPVEMAAEEEQRRNEPDDEETEEGEK